MRFATDPFWVRLRWILFVLFWIIWIAMLVASIVIIIYAPKCPSPDPKQWWQKGPIYKVDIANFKDSNNDGTGDIKGITKFFSHLFITFRISSLGSATSNLKILHVNIFLYFFPTFQDGSIWKKTLKLKI